MSRHLLVVIALAVSQPVSTQSWAEPTTVAADLPPHRQLFLDDVMIEQMDGLRRLLHQPEKYVGNPIIRHHQRPWQKFRAQLYGTVLYIPEEKIFKMWYLAGSRFPNEDPIRLKGRLVCPNFQLLAYAESDDGFRWTLPDLDLVDWNGSTHNNLCDFARENAEGVAVVYDRGDPDPNRRYKAFYWEHANCGPREFDPVTPVNAMSVSFSADGKTWTNHPGNPVIPLASDSGQQAVWDPALKKYVVYGRFGAGGRRIARAESDDFVHWSSPKLVFETDTADGPGAQFYGMGTTIYEGVYIGLPWVYWQDTSNRMDVQLATSRDGIKWQRAGGRQTFIPNGHRGTWDGGCIFTAAQPLQTVGDTVFIFYSALMLDHEEPRPTVKDRPEYGESSIGVATIRRDGFVSLSAGEDGGSVTTKPFRLPQGELHINADARLGLVLVHVLDASGSIIAESEVVYGDQMDATVQFTGAMSPGDVVSLRFVLKSGDLYSYWFASS